MVADAAHRKYRLDDDGAGKHAAVYRGDGNDRHDGALRRAYFTTTVPMRWPMARAVRM